MPDPKPDDWLTSMDRHGQTVGAFKRGWRNEVTDSRRTLYISERPRNGTHVRGSAFYSLSLRYQWLRESLRDRSHGSLGLPSVFAQTASVDSV